MEEAHARASETEQKLCRVLGEYIQTWEKEFVRPHYVMDKMWRMMQSNDSKTMNLDKDFEEMLDEAKRSGWTGSTTTSQFWAEEEEHDP